MNNKVYLYSFLILILSSLSGLIFDGTAYGLLGFAYCPTVLLTLLLGVPEVFMLIFGSIFQLIISLIIGNLINSSDKNKTGLILVVLVITITISFASSKFVSSLFENLAHS